MMQHRFPLCVLLAMTAAIGGCAVGPDYAKPETTVTDGWHGGTPEVNTGGEAEQLADWWQRFNDPMLTRLVEEAALHNKEIAIALANVERARALRGVVRGNLYPSIGVGGDFSRRGNSQANNNNFTGDKERDTYTSAADAAWELDFFGRARRAIEQADANREAVMEAKNGVVLSVVAEVARNYFIVRGLQKRILVAKRNVELLGEVEELAKNQFELGVVTEFDYARARGEREATAALIPNLEAEMQAGIYRISVLTGKKPETYLDTLLESEPLPMPPDSVPVGLRSDILKRRPDVRQAERELAAATAGIGLAETELYPNLTLTGSLGTNSIRFSELFTTEAIAYALSAAVDWSLFEGGSLRAGVEVANAEQRAALARYEQAILLALEDAEAALLRYGKEWQTLKQLYNVKDSREEAFEIARLRYEVGEENFLVMLDAERALITVRDDIIESETRILTALTQLYKALGGGWAAIPTASAPTESPEQAPPPL